MSSEQNRYNLYRTGVTPELTRRSSHLNLAKVAGSASAYLQHLFMSISHPIYYPCYLPFYFPLLSSCYHAYFLFYCSRVSIFLRSFTPLLSSDLILFFFF